MSKVLSDYVLWDEFVAKGVVALTNGAFQRSYKLMPPSLDHVSNHERLATAERQNYAYRRLRDSYGLHFEEVFLPADGYAVPVDWPTQASALLDAERERDCLARGSQLESRQFVTVTSKPKKATAEWFKRWMFTSTKQVKRDVERELLDFLRTCEEIESTLSGVLSLRALSDNETASYLHFTATHSWQRVDAKAHPKLGAMLPVEPFDPYWGVGKLGSQYVQLVALSGYDNGTKPNMLEALDVRFPYRRVTRWLPMERGDARGLLRSRQQDAGMEETGAREELLAQVDKTHKPRASMADPQATADAEAAKKAGGQLDRRGLGMMTTTYVVWDESRDACQEKAKALRREIANAGLVTKSESLGVWGTWLGTLPGHLEPGARKVPLTTRNLADLAPSTRKWPGEQFDKGLAKCTGVKRPLLYTADPRPFRLTSAVDGGSANMAIFGSVGSGKSTLVNQICMQALVSSEVQVISLSKGRSELGPCLLSGGVEYAIGSQRASLAFQPFAHIDQPDEMRFAAEWLEGALAAVKCPVSPAQRIDLQESLSLMAAKKAPKFRTVTELRKDLTRRAPELSEALKPFSLEGLYGHIFDGNNADALGWRRWTMFDISALLAETVPAWVTEAATSMLLHLTYSRFNGQPTIMVCEEYPQYLHLERLRSAFASILDSRRKDQVRLFMVAQTPKQLAPYPELVASVQGACKVRLFGRDGSAKDRLSGDAYREWSVNESMLSAIAHLDQGHFLCTHPKGTREFDVRSGPLALAMCGMNEPHELKLLSELYERCKGDPDELLHALLVERKLELKAKELGRWMKARKAAA